MTVSIADYHEGWLGDMPECEVVIDALLEGLRIVAQQQKDGLVFKYDTTTVELTMDRHHFDTLTRFLEYEDGLRQVGCVSLRLGVVVVCVEVDRDITLAMRADVDKVYQPTKVYGVLNYPYIPRL